MIGHAGHDSDAQCRTGSGVGRDSVSPASSPSFAQPFTPDIGDEAPSRLGEQRRDPVPVPHHGLVAVPRRSLGSPGPRMDCEGGIRRRRAPGYETPCPPFPRPRDRAKCTARSSPAESTASPAPSHAAEGITRAGKGGRFPRTKEIGWASAAEKSRTRRVTGRRARRERRTERGEAIAAGATGHERGENCEQNAPQSSKRRRAGFYARPASPARQPRTGRGVAPSGSARFRTRFRRRRLYK